MNRAPRGMEESAVDPAEEQWAVVVTFGTSGALRPRSVVFIQVLDVWARGIM